MYCGRCSCRRAGETSLSPASTTRMASYRSGCVHALPLLFDYPVELLTAHPAPDHVKAASRNARAGAGRPVPVRDRQGSEFEHPSFLLPIGMLKPLDRQYAVDWRPEGFPDPNAPVESTEVRASRDVLDPADSGLHTPGAEYYSCIGIGRGARRRQHCSRTASHADQGARDPALRHQSAAHATD